MTLKTCSSHPVRTHKHLCINSLGDTPTRVVDIRRIFKLLCPRKSLCTSKHEAAENAARLVLTQLSERLNFYRHQSKSDEEMECLEFGICCYQPKDKFLGVPK